MSLHKPFRFVATAATTIAHGEAGANSTGPNNTTLFARELTLLRRDQLGFSADQADEAIATVLAVIPITKSAADFLRTLSGGELVATLFAAQFPIVYSGEGQGLFSGLERYQYLTTRLVDAATSCSTLPTAWGYVSRKLSLTAPGVAAQKPLLALFALPKAIQSAALTAILKAPELIVMGARLLADSAKATNAQYADAAKVELERAVTYSATDTQLAELAGDNGRTLAARIPALSGNSLRHNLMRAPGATRLLTALGLTPDREIVPIGVERFLYSGGNTTKGARAPGAADYYEAIVRREYPLIDALGGSMDQFVMTRSAASIASWIVCRENNWITEKKTNGAVRSDASIFDLVSEVTRTRSGIGGKDKESGQMIFSYEVLAAQTSTLIEISWQPYTLPLTVGATFSAVRDWAAQGGVIGARAAQGHSQLIPDFGNEDRFPLADHYEEYLLANAERLRAGLINATFCTEATLCAA